MLQINSKDWDKEKLVTPRWSSKVSWRTFIKWKEIWEFFQKCKVSIQLLLTLGL